MIPRDASGPIRNRRWKIRKASRAIWGWNVQPYSKLLSAYAPANRGRFQSRDNHPSTSNRTFLSNHRRPVVSLLQTKRQRPIIEQRREYTFSRRGYIWSNMRAAVCVCVCVCVRACVRVRCSRETESGRERDREQENGRAKTDWTVKDTQSPEEYLDDGGNIL